MEQEGRGVGCGEALLAVFPQPGLCACPLLHASEGAGTPWDLRLQMAAAAPSQVPRRLLLPNRQNKEGKPRATTEPFHAVSSEQEGRRVCARHASEAGRVAAHTFTPPTPPPCLQKGPRAAQLPIRLLHAPILTAWEKRVSVKQPRAHTRHIVGLQCSSESTHHPRKGLPSATTWSRSRRESRSDT